MRLSVGLPGSCDASMLSLGLQAMKVLWPVQQVFGFLPETLKALKKGHDIAFVSRDLAVHTHTQTQGSPCFTHSLREIQGVLSEILRFAK